MTIWFVTRHVGAVEWARRKGIVASDFHAEDERVVESINPENVARGDQVIGTLPVHLAADICGRGGRYFHITMTVPNERRGQELSPDDMEAFGANCREFIVMGTAPVSSSQATPLTFEPGQGVHVCLVSDQHWANLLPILKRRPARVELVCTPAMLKPGRGLERIARALERNGYGEHNVTPHLAPAESATDFHVARQYAHAVREELQQRYPDSILTLNATGGTKILSNAFFLEFQGFETLYTDTEGGGFIRHMEDTSRAPEPLGSLVGTMEDYLYCQGYRILRTTSNDKDWQAQAHARQALSESLVAALGGADAEQHGALIGTLNRRSEEVVREVFNAHPEGLKPKCRNAILDQFVPETNLNSISCPKGAHPMLERLLSDGLLARRNEGDHRYYFPSHDALRYLGGGWLEEWAWLVAKECGADDCRAGVFIQAGDEAPKERADNELDLVLLHRNRLFIAECKTINWQGANGKQDVLNKLDAMGSHARGLFGKSYLVSARPLDNDAKRRCGAYGITVLEADAMPRLQGEIRKWMEGSS
jgi:putative CRISPR-associated protein (TIGR02620 family)